ncbi:hypothetical protein [Halegenticoccus soli]|uniref:hypothetical protein n=1 Tax=Halegenticoccus soli TaxID=1985678 RepID=UPI000C6DFEF5|nr:hypothetical protein [Halegenticoccus soli]
MREAISGAEPTVAESAFISKMTSLTGDVAVGDRTSIWPFVCLRRDEPGVPTVVGEECNVQEFTMLHGGEIGDDVSIGHSTVVDHTESRRKPTTTVVGRIRQTRRDPPTIGALSR